MRSGSPTATICFDQVRDLQRRAVAILERAEEDGDHRVQHLPRSARPGVASSFLVGSLESCKNGKRLMCWSIPQWVEIRGAILAGARTSRGAAREAVTRALGNGGKCRKLTSQPISLLPWIRQRCFEGPSENQTRGRRRSCDLEHRASFSLCARQTGKSTTTAALALYEVLYRPGASGATGVTFSSPESRNCSGR